MKRFFVLICLLAVFALAAQATPSFYSTATPAAWSVAISHGPDGQLSSFDTSHFVAAVPNSSGSHAPDWIATTSDGTTGGIGYWTFMVFRQTFDLTGYDPTNANLQFQWAADDSGEGFADRGTWIPRFYLNGSSTPTYYPGASLTQAVNTYSYSSTVTVSDGFVAGLNYIDFYVEGNGVTDGFALKTVSFTAAPATGSNTVPEPGAIALLASGLFGLAGWRRKLTAK